MRKIKPIPALSDDEVRRFRALSGPPEVRLGVPNYLGPCLPWHGSRCHNGYGQFKLNRVQFLASRLAFVLGGGQFTADKPLACHKCDQPDCVEFTHLFAGSDKDNFDDMRAKGRGATCFNSDGVRVFKRCGHPVYVNLLARDRCPQCAYKDRPRQNHRRRFSLKSYREYWKIRPDMPFVDV